jgi:hypothetical protein
VGIKSVVVLNFTLLFLAQILVTGVHAKPSDDPEAKEVSADPELKYKEDRCDKDLPTLSVGIENLIKTKPEWDQFVRENPLFVVGGADSTCEACCDSEVILRDL